MGAPGARIAAVGPAFPQQYYDQATLLERLATYLQAHGADPRLLERLHRNVQVDGRHLALPIDEYDRLSSWGEANAAWLRVAEELGGEAIERALERAGVARADIDVLVFTTVTGVATPSLDVRLINRLGLPAGVRRVPMFGLGCVAGAAGVARAADLLRNPEEVALLLSVELCSLTIQRDDVSVANLVASGLFGDGAAAVVVTGAGVTASGPQIVASRSVLYPDSEGVMGWEVGASGFKVVLTAEVPQMVRDHLRRDVDAFLAEHGVARSDVGVWIAHPGGPRVMEAMEEALELPPAALELAWRSLREKGNISSTSVLLVLDGVLRRKPAAGTWGLMTAMGPGFCSELVLLRF